MCQQARDQVRVSPSIASRSTRSSETGQVEEGEVPRGAGDEAPTLEGLRRDGPPPGRTPGDRRSDATSAPDLAQDHPARAAGTPRPGAQTRPLASCRPSAGARRPRAARRSAARTASRGTARGRTGRRACTAGASRAPTLSEAADRPVEPVEGIDRLGRARDRHGGRARRSRCSRRRSPARRRTSPR